MCWCCTPNLVSVQPGLRGHPSGRGWFGFSGHRWDAETSGPEPLREGPRVIRLVSFPQKMRQRHRGVFVLSLLGPQEAVSVPCNPSFLGRASGALTTSGGRGVCEGGWRMAVTGDGCPGVLDRHGLATTGHASPELLMN